MSLRNKSNCKKSTHKRPSKLLMLRLSSTRIWRSHGWIILHPNNPSPPPTRIRTGYFVWSQSNFQISIGPCSWHTWRTPSSSGSLSNTCRSNQLLITQKAGKMSQRTGRRSLQKCNIMMTITVWGCGHSRISWTCHNLPVRSIGRRSAVRWSSTSHWSRVS